MNNIANNIKQRLSMREPLCEALDVVVQITDRLTLNKSPEEIDAAHATQAAQGQKTILFNLDREPRYYAWIAFQGGYLS